VPDSSGARAASAACPLVDISLRRPVRTLPMKRLLIALADPERWGHASSGMRGPSRDADTTAGRAWETRMLVAEARMLARPAYLPVSTAPEASRLGSPPHPLLARPRRLGQAGPPKAELPMSTGELISPRGPRKRPWGRVCVRASRLGRSQPRARTVSPHPGYARPHGRAAKVDESSRL
jgi:hypothetical protein